MVIDNDNDKVYDDYLCGDKAYDSKETRALVKGFGLKPKITKRGLDQDDKPKSKNKKARRWVVERTFSWFNKFAKCRFRTEKKSLNYLSILHLVAGIMTYRVMGVFG